MAEFQLHHERVFRLACDLYHDNSIRLRSDSNIQYAPEYKPQNSPQRSDRDRGETERANHDLCCVVRVNTGAISRFGRDDGARFARSVV